MIWLSESNELRSHLYSTDILLADSAGGVLLSPAASIPFQAGAGKDQTFTFTVVGFAGNAQ